MDDLSRHIDVDTDSDGPSGAVVGALVGIVALLLVACLAGVGVLVEFVQLIGG